MQLQWEQNPTRNSNRESCRADAPIQQAPLPKINQVKSFIRRLKRLLLETLARGLYPKDDVQLYLRNRNLSPAHIVRTGVMQKVLGFNRSVPWPIHFTSSVIHWERVKRIPGRASPGWSPGCYIQAINGITFGTGVFVGPGVKIISANHSLDNLKEHDPGAPIVIGDDCWLGANAVILPGVRLGPRTIVGAGAVVTKSFEEGNCVVAGNPAKVIKAVHVSTP